MTRIAPPPLDAYEREIILPANYGNRLDRYRLATSTHAKFMILVHDLIHMRGRTILIT